MEIGLRNSKNVWKCLGRKREASVIRDTYKCICVCVCAQLGDDQRESEVNKTDLEVQGPCLKKMYSASRIHRLAYEKSGKAEMGRWNVGKKGGEERSREDQKGKVRTCSLCPVAQTFPRCMWDHSAITGRSFLRQNEAHAHWHNLYFSLFNGLVYMRANDFRWNSFKFVTVWQKREQRSQWGLECSIISSQEPLWNQRATHKSNPKSLMTSPKFSSRYFPAVQENSALHTQNEAPALSEELWLLVKVVDPPDAASAPFVSARAAKQLRDLAISAYNPPPSQSDRERTDSKSFPTPSLLFFKAHLVKSTC